MKSTHAQAAAAIKVELKAIGIKCKASSSSYSMGNSVDVTVYDQSGEAMNQIKAICAKYQYGHFNGMDDCYEYSNKRDDLPQSKYVSVNNELSDAFVSEGIAKVNARFNKCATLEQYRQGGLPQLRENGNFGDYYEELHSVLSGDTDYVREDAQYSRRCEVEAVLVAVYGYTNGQKADSDIYAWMNDGEWIVTTSGHLGEAKDKRG